jgi:hypothetical protein
LASEKKAYGCFCAGTAKRRIGRSCDTASINDGLDDLAHRAAPGGNARDTVIVRAARDDLQLEVLFGVVA